MNRYTHVRRSRPAAMAGRVACCVVLAVAAGSCSRSDQPRLGAVHGTVTLDDAPLAGAMVVFTPAAGGRQSFAVTDNRGEYDLIYLRDTKGAILGRHQVAITTANEEAPAEQVPAKYNSATTLDFVVEPGSNRAPFDLHTQ